ARQTEIDFVELAHNVNDCFKNHPPAPSGTNFGRTSISIAEVLSHHPATQGIASIVGLVALALDQGIAQEGDELLYWESDENQRYRARIPKLAFTGEVDA
ncbi:MAG: DUF3375 family protein, partial [Raoultibacter sp.]